MGCWVYLAQVPQLQQWLSIHQPSAGKPEAFRHTKMEIQAPSQLATAVEQFHLSFGSQQVLYSEKVTEDIIQQFLKLKY